MAKKLQKKERLILRLVSVLTFLILFNLLAIPLYIALYTDFSIPALQELNAKMASATLNLFGHKTSTDGISINLLLEGIAQRIEISWDSTGWKSMYATATLILVTPISTILRRIKSAIIGVAIIFLINYLRVTTTILISAKFGFSFFDVIHTVLWREGLILAVVGVWLIWMRMEKYNLWKIK